MRSEVKEQREKRGVGGKKWGEKGARLQDASESIEVLAQWPIIRMRDIGGGGTGANAKLFEVREGFKGVKEA